MNHREDSTDIFNYGYTYTDGINTADDMRGLQQLYNYYGATEMYVRIATARYYPDESAEDYYHAKMHCLEESKKVCSLAAESSYFRIKACNSSVFTFICHAPVF